MGEDNNNRASHFQKIEMDQKTGKDEKMIPSAYRW